MDFIVRPRIKLCFKASLYSLLLVSNTFFGRFSLLCALLISDNAWDRFRFLLSDTLLLLCHFLSRYSLSRISGLRFFPYASLFRQPIVVLKPLSWIRSVDGAPTRGRFSLWIGSKALHSGPVFSSVVEKTIPHCWHTSSPVVSSMRILLLPHSVHVSCCFGVVRLLKGIRDYAKAPHIDITIHVRCGYHYFFL